ncbi:response regulator [Marinicrinis lubricantis]
MIVDDEPVILNGLRYMIQKENSLFTEIEAMTDSVEALNRMDAFRPDLLITDIQMPELSGLDLVREAKQKQVRRAVILTGYDMFQYAQQAIRLKVADYMLKPIRRQDLSALLSKLGSEMMEEKKRKAGLLLSHAVPSNREIVKEEGSSNIAKFKSFVQQNYMKDLSLDEVAEHLELHPNYVCSLIKRETGKTFVTYLHSVRIDKAKDLLQHVSDMPMDRIAKNVGYENPRHFYKVFKQYVGLTPGTYRESRMS